jgi:hypothetical protein
LLSRQRGIFREETFGKVYSKRAGDSELQPRHIRTAAPLQPVVKVAEIEAALRWQTLLAATHEHHQGCISGDIDLEETTFERGRNPYPEVFVLASACFYFIVVLARSDKVIDFACTSEPSPPGCTLAVRVLVASSVARANKVRSRQLVML